MTCTLRVIIIVYEINFGHNFIANSFGWYNFYGRTDGILATASHIAESPGELLFGSSFYLPI